MLLHPLAPLCPHLQQGYIRPARALRGCQRTNPWLWLLLRGLAVLLLHTATVANSCAWVKAGRCRGTQLVSTGRLSLLFMLQPCKLAGMLCRLLLLLLHERVSASIPAFIFGPKVIPVHSGQVSSLLSRRTLLV